MNKMATAIIWKILSGNGLNNWSGIIFSINTTDVAYKADSDDDKIKAVKNFFVGFRSIIVIAIWLAAIKHTATKTKVVLAAKMSIWFILAKIIAPKIAQIRDSIKVL